MSNNFTLLCSKERHVIKWGCINTYLRSQVCSIHSLACKTSSHQVAWWIYRQVDHWCLYSQCKCPLFVGDLLWSDGRHLCALFLSVEPDCWWASRHFHCHIAMALVWSWFQSPSKLPSSIGFVHNNYRPQCTPLRRLIVQHYFVSLTSKRQVIYLGNGTLRMCFFYQSGTRHNPNWNSLQFGILHLWDTQA